jgi:hypothetical protein
MPDVAPCIERVDLVTQAAELTPAATLERGKLTVTETLAWLLDRPREE